MTRHSPIADRRLAPPRLLATLGLWAAWAALPAPAQKPAALDELRPAAAAPASPVPAPDASAFESDVQIKVTRAPVQRQLISVPMNQGALVDFNVPIREVRVTNAEIADVAVTSPKQILVQGKSFGTTQLIAVVDGGVQRIFTIAVDLDLERLQASITENVPRSKVKAAGMLDTVVLTGYVPDAESAERIMQIANIYSEKVVNQMRVAGVQQVLLRCTVAEVNRTATRQLGVNGWIAGDSFRDMFVVSQVGGINPVNIGAAGGFSVTSPVPFATDQQGLPLGTTPTLSLGFPGVQMQVFLRALRENGLLKVLAEPNLVAISGQEASFLAGGEFPIPIAQRDSIAIDYREYGVKLVFTPAVLSENVIRIRVAPEVSEPDFSNSVRLSGFVVPGLISRRAETVVELAPGQTFALGGLLSERTRGVASKVPALGDVPVLGALFSSTDYQKSESELVILVTPEIVEPLNPGEVAYVPGASHVDPSDWELLALGKLDGTGTQGSSHKVNSQPAPKRAQPATRSGAGARLRGPVGPAGENEGNGG